MEMASWLGRLHPVHMRLDHRDAGGRPLQLGLPCRQPGRQRDTCYLDLRCRRPLRQTSTLHSSTSAKATSKLSTLLQGGFHIGPFSPSQRGQCRLPTATATALSISACGTETSLSSGIWIREVLTLIGGMASQMELKETLRGCSIHWESMKLP